MTDSLALLKMAARISIFPLHFVFGGSRNAVVIFVSVYFVSCDQVHLRECYLRLLGV